MTPTQQCFDRANRSTHYATRALVILAVIFLILTIFGLAGCQNVGPKHTFDRGGATLDTPSPVTLDIQDDDKRGTATGVGPARWTSITEGEVQTFQTGSTPRDMWVKKNPDGTLQFNLSSGTDVRAKGVEFDATTGSFKLGEMDLSASEPIRAGNEAYDRLVAYWTSLSADQKEAHLADVEALKVTAPELADLILGIVSGL